MSDQSKNIIALIVFVGTCMGGGIVSGLATADSVRTWYPTLQKPAFNPPSWVFGPVWTILYIAMGVAAFLVWRQRGRHPRAAALALAMFAIQLLINFSWSPIFFGAQSIMGGLVVIVVLWLAVAATIILMWRVSRAAWLLMLPYFGWISFAGVLNASIAHLNR